MLKEMEKRVLGKYGLPQQIITDGSPEFQNEFKEAFKLIGMDRVAGAHNTTLQTDLGKRRGEAHYSTAKG